jgi:hypothetical protein
VHLNVLNFQRLPIYEKTWWYYGERCCAPFIASTIASCSKQLNPGTFILHEKQPKKQKHGCEHIASLPANQDKTEGGTF